MIRYHIQFQRGLTWVPRRTFANILHLPPWHDAHAVATVMLETRLRLQQHGGAELAVPAAPIPGALALVVADAVDALAAILDARATHDVNMMMMNMNNNVMK